MNYSCNSDNGILSISIECRLDTETSHEFEAGLVEICRDNPHESMLIDAEKLQYSVFEMTGFS